MNKTLLITSLLTLCGAAGANAQSAMDGFQFSQQDLKGTARFMSMGGAFGALGGDLTTLNQNPAGIGVYRSNELGFTVDLDAQSSKGTAQGISKTADQTKFYLNNIGFVSTIRLDGALKNFNLGFTYNKTASFNRRYRGTIPTLKGSMSNYIAGLANFEGITEGDVKTQNNFDPYNPNDGYYTAPWINILGYDSYLVTPWNQSSNETIWEGQWQTGTSGSGSFYVDEKGALDEFNIALGGNVSNVVYWGMDFGIESFTYEQNSVWSENLTNAWVDNSYCDARWNLGNYYRVTGTGFNYKLGVIVKPIQELRLGFAFHTPTWYDLDESSWGYVDYNYTNSVRNGTAETNNGYDAVYDFKFRTPWKFIFSAAGVIGNRCIISADYEIQKYSNMKFTDKYASNWYDDDDVFGYTNSDIKDYYKTQTQLRLGAEFRVTNHFSLRAGYSHVSSPVKADAKDGRTTIYPAGTRMSYAFDNTTNYLTCGFGYRSGGFYLDMAYVWKHRDSEFNAYPEDYGVTYHPTAKISSVNNQVVLSMGYKF